MLFRSRQPKDGKEVPATDRERMIKSKAGLVINIFAALLAFNMWLQGSLNSKVMNNTIQANDLWVFYQAKSIKQTAYELAASQTTDPVKAKKFEEKAKSIEVSQYDKEFDALHRLLDVEHSDEILVSNDMNIDRKSTRLNSSH